MLLAFFFSFFFNSNLMFVTEWKQIVARLILMSYELSAVVSPVVQSSSPEGLIPMDIDSGKQTNKKNSVKSEALEVAFISYCNSGNNSLHHSLSNFYFMSSS